MPWKSHLNKWVLFSIGILLPFIFSILIRTIFNVLNLGGLGAILLIITIPPFAYIVSRNPTGKETAK